ncbi:MAG: carboxypeptidase-like regulatory domain-containing protein [Anaerolineales bacterium]
MTISDSPKLEYDASGRPPEIKPPWLKRYGLRASLIALIMIFTGLTLFGLVREKDVINNQGTLIGQVVDPQGQPLPTAQIFVSGVETWTTSDDAGRFRLEAIPAGEHEVTIVVNPTTFDSTTDEPIEPVSQLLHIPTGQTIDAGVIVYGHTP